MIDALQIHLNRWFFWREQTVNRRIFSAILTIGGFTILVKLAATAKELVVAYQFGTADALDAFLIAFLIPSFALNVLAGSVNAALIPTYIQVREQEGREAAQRLFSNVMTLSICSLLAVTVLLALTITYILPVIGSGFSPEKLALTRSLFFVLLPILVFSGLTTTWAAILNAGERFSLVAIAPIVTPVIAIAVLLMMGKAWGIYALAVGIVSGFALEAIVIARGLTRVRISLVPRWYGMDPSVRQVISQYVPMVAGAFLMGSTVLVDQAMAAMLGPGSVSVLSFGNKLVALLLALGAGALSTAVFPYFSRMVAIGDWSGIRHTLKTYAQLILFISVPLTLILVYFSEPLVGLIFERGAFTGSDTMMVAQAQQLYLLQVPFYIMGIMLVRLVSSLKANHILMWGTAISVVLNITLNYLFMKWLGVSGIALSTSAVYIVSFCYLSFMMMKLLKKTH